MAGGPPLLHGGTPLAASMRTVRCSTGVYPGEGTPQPVPLTSYLGLVIGWPRLAFGSPRPSYYIIGRRPSRQFPSPKQLVSNLIRLAESKTRPGQSQSTTSTDLDWSVSAILGLSASAWPGLSCPVCHGLAWPGHVWSGRVMVWPGLASSSTQPVLIYC